MRLALSLVWVVVLALCNWVYLSRAKVLKAEGISAKISAVLKCRTIIKVYTAIALVAMIYLAFWQESVFARTFFLNIRYITLIGLLVPLAYEDFFTRRISNKVVLTGLIMRVLLYILEFIGYDREYFWTTFKQSLMGFLIGLAFLLLGCFVIKDGIGMGDVKMLMILGLYLGLYPAMTAILFSLIVSFVSAVVLLIKRSKGRKDTLPFAPCVLIGTFLSMILTTPI